MTQEEKQLLLIDLCARLPYGVNFQSGINNESSFKITAGEWWEGERERITYILSHIQEFKYYLRPMSSMTEEEREEWLLIDIETHLDNGAQVLNGEEVDFLLSHHFDYRGLIEKGLAFEAPENMYKNK